MRQDSFPVLLVTIALLCTTAPAASGYGSGPAATARIADNDNDLGNATELTSGSAMTGNLSSTDDPVDFFRINAGTTKVINATLYINSFPGFKAKLVVYDISGAITEESNQGAQWESVCILAEKSGNYYFSVNISSGSTGDYTLQVNVENPQVIQPGNLLDGYLVRPGNSTTRWFTFTMNGNTNGGVNNDLANFTVFKDPSVAIDVVIYDLWPEYFLLPFNISLNHGSGATISAAATYTCSYYLKISARSGSGNFNVTMGTLQTAPGDNNHDAANSQFIRNAPVAGSIDQSFDNYDWYKLYLLDTETMNLKMTLDNYVLGKYQIWVFTITGGNYIALFNVSNFVPGTGWTNSITINYQPPASAHYFIIPMAVHSLDAQGLISSRDAVASFTFNLISPNPLNHAPVLLVNPGYPVTNEDTPFVPFLLNGMFTEVDGDTMSFCVTGSEHLAVKLGNDGAVTVTPAKDWAGMETISLTVTDSLGAVNSVPAPIQVVNVNDRPVITRQLPNVTFSEDSSFGLNISGAFHDPDVPYGDTLRIVWVGNASIPMYLDNDTMIVTFGPVYQYFGARDITFRAYDNSGYLAAQKITLTVVHTNHYPEFKGSDRIDITMKEDGTNTSFNANDYFTDKDLFYATEALAYFGNRSEHINCTVASDGKITVKPEADWNGQEMVYVLATDVGNATLALQVSVEVEPVNDAPVFLAFSPNKSEVTINETDTLDLSVTAFDGDTPALALRYSWFLDGNKTGASGPNYSFTTDLNSSGSHKILVTVSDGEFNISHCWTVPVFNKNQKPNASIITPKNNTVVPEGTMISFRVDAQDPELDKLSYTWKEGNFTIGQTRTLSYKFGPGNHTIRALVYDGTDTMEVTVGLFVDSVPNVTISAPLDRASFKDNLNIKFSGDVYDRDGDVVTYRWRDGSKQISNGLNFTKKLSVGVHYISLNATDARGNGFEQQIVIKVEKSGGGGFIPGFETLVWLLSGVVSGLGFRHRRRL